MTIRLTERRVRLVLLDIEGTTTPMAFVRDVLFPFAVRRIGPWLAERAGSADCAVFARDFAAEHARDAVNRDAPPPWHDDNDHRRAESIEAYARWLMARDRKSPALKRLQGLIWEDGYRTGELRGRVFEDVPAAFARWRAADVGVAIYSSGSELAQRRLFDSTESGDLTPFISGFFDTSVGGKRESSSYARIAALLDLAPAQILFVSDVTAELAAARAVGCQTALSIRPGNDVQTDRGEYDVVESLAAIE